MTKGLYDFTDIAPVTGAVADIKPAESMRIGGVYLEDVVPGYRTLQATGRELHAQEVTTQTVGIADGDPITAVRSPSRTITVTYQIDADDAAGFRTAYTALTRALRSKETRQAIFDDNPAVYWNVVLSDADVPDGGRLSVVSTFSLYVPDGCAHAVDVKTFEPDSNGIVTVVNQGTALSYPVIELTMNSENGYAAVVNDEGAISFGDPDEVDAVAGTRSDKPVHLTFREGLPTGVEVNTNCVTIYPYRLFNEGAAAYKNTFTGDLLWGAADTGEATTPSFGTKGQKNWHGPALHMPIPVNYNGVLTGDFEYKVRLGFGATNKTTGRMECTLESHGAPAMSIIVRDSNLKNANKTIEYWIGTEMKYTRDLNIKKFPNYFAEASITRAGDKAVFKFARIDKLTSDTTYKAGGVDTQPYTVPGLDELEIDGFTQWIQQYGDDTPATMYWTDTKFNWVNEATLTNVPNLFDEGDVLTIDTKNCKAYLNGVPSGLFTIGNQFDSFATNGDTMLVKAVASDWATPMSVKVYLEEAYA